MSYMAYRSDAWLAGVSRGTAAQTSYQNAQARLGELTANMGNLLAAFEAARDAFAENPDASGKEVVDAAYEAYMASQEAVAEQQSEMSTMQQMYAANMGVGDGSEQQNVLGERINGVVDRIEELEGARQGYVGTLRIAQELGIEPDLSVSVPENVDDWANFSASFGEESSGEGNENDGHDMTVQGLTDSISQIDAELMALYQTYDTLREQYDGYGSVQGNKGLEMRQRMVSAQKVLNAPTAMYAAKELLNVVAPEVGKMLDLPDPEEETVIADESGYAFDAFDMHAEEEYDPNAGAEERLFANVAAIEQNMSAENDFGINLLGSW